MSITRCKYCELEHDTDYEAEHEEECLCYNFGLELDELEKMGVISEIDRGRIDNELDAIFGTDKLEERMKGIKTELSKRKL